MRPTMLMTLTVGFLYERYRVQTEDEFTDDGKFRHIGDAGSNFAELPVLILEFSSSKHLNKITELKYKFHGITKTEFYLHKLKLPSDNRVVNFRPFLVKEEKLLLPQLNLKISSTDFCSYRYYYCLHRCARR